MNTTAKIVSAPLAGAAYVKGRNTNATLVHAVELDSSGEPIKVLCGKVKLSNVLDDSSQYDTHPVSCPTCQNLMASLGGRRPYNGLYDQPLTENEIDYAPWERERH
jgi:hypothetical protein